MKSSLSSKYVKMGVQVFVCESVCLLVRGGLMVFQTPVRVLIKFWMHIPTCSKKALVQF